MICDRTQTDVLDASRIRAKYQALHDWSGLTQVEINQLERGTYTNVSLNRVESAMKNVAETFNGFGYNINLITKTWAEGDYFDESELERYLSNLNTLRSAIAVLQSTPQTPDNYNTWQQANDIERILVDLEDSLDRLSLGFWYCGEAYCGEV